MDKMWRRCTMNCACLVITWLLCQTVNGRRLREDSVLTMKIGQTSREPPNAKSKTFSEDKATRLSQEKLIDTRNLPHEKTEGLSTATQTQSVLDGFSSPNIASSKQTGKSESPPSALPERRPLVAPPLDSRWIRPTTVVLPKHKGSSSRLDSLPKNRAKFTETKALTTPPRKQMKDELKIELKVFEFPSIKLQSRTWLQDALGKSSNPLLQDIFSTTWKNILSPPQEEMRIFDGWESGASKANARSFDSVFFPEDLGNERRILDKVLNNPKPEPDFIKSFFRFKAASKQDNDLLPSLGELQKAFKLTFPDPTDLELMVDGSRSPDAGRVREHLNDEENTNILLASQQEHYKIKPDISSVGDIVQILNNEQPAEKMFTGSDTSLERSDTLEQLINLPEKIFKNTFAVLEDEEQKPNTSNIFPVWSFQGYLDDKFRSREESEKNVDQTVFDRLNALLEGKLISQMFGQEESRSSAESQQNRLRHRHPRSVPSHSMPQDDKIVVYVPLGLPVGQKLLDPTHAMKEAHTDTTVYSVVPDLSVVKVNERGELFLNGTGDVGAVYDFVIRAVQGTGSEPETRHEQQVLLHFQDNDDVVVRYDNEAQVYRRPGAYVMRVKVLTVIQDRCIEIAEPAMRDLFLAEPDGTVLVRANEEQLDKDFYHFHLLIKNRVDETILAKLPIVVYFLDEEASVDIKLEVVAKSQRFLLVGLLILMSIVIVAIAGALLFKRLKLGKESNRYSTAYGGAVDLLKSSNINDRGTASTGTNSKTLQADVATTARQNSSKPFIDDEHCYEEVNSPDKNMLIV